MNDSSNIVLTKALDFAVRIVNLYKLLTGSKSEFIMSKQLLRCGTSIGANLSEAQEAISKKEFEMKVYISLKEARETKYWIELLYRTGFLADKEYESIMADCCDLLKLLASITKTLRAEH